MVLLALLKVTKKFRDMVLASQKSKNDRRYIVSTKRVASDSPALYIQESIHVIKKLTGSQSVRVPVQISF